MQTVTLQTEVITHDVRTAGLWRRRRRGLLAAFLRLAPVTGRGL